MKASDDLFQLIKSLEKQEKRYFKLFLNRSGERSSKNMVLLFDAMDRLEVYDEERIKTKFKGQAFAKQLHVAKNRLSKSILRSLELYHSENSLENSINRLMHQAAILYKKGLIKQSYKILGKAKTIAQENEMFTVLLQIIRLEISDYGDYLHTNTILEKATLEYDTSLELLRKEKNYLDMNLLSAKLRVQVRKGNSQMSEEELNANINEYELELLNDEKKALSYRSRVHFYITNSVYYRLLNKHFKSLVYRKKLVEYLQNNPSNIQNYTRAYITALNNLLGGQIELEQYNEAEDTLERLKKLSERKEFKMTEKNTKDVNERILMIDQMLAYSTFNFSRGIASEEKVFRSYNLSEFLSTDRKYITLFYLGLNRFSNGDSEISLDIFDKLKEEQIDKRRPDIYVHVLMLTLLIQYELKNYIYLASLVRNTTRAINQRKTVFKYQKLLLRFFTNVVKYADEKAHKDALITLLEKIEELTDNEQELQHMSSINTQAWIKSKIEGSSMKEILDDKIRIN